MTKKDFRTVIRVLSILLQMTASNYVLLRLNNDDQITGMPQMRYTTIEMLVEQQRA